MALSHARHHARAEGADDLAKAERLIKDHGYYPVALTPEERDEYTSDEDKLEELFHEQMRKTVEEWVEWADVSSRGARPCEVFVCPGNDDREDIDEILATSKHIIVGEGNVLDLPGGISSPRVAGRQPDALGHPARGRRAQAQAAHP